MMRQATVLVLLALGCTSAAGGGEPAADAESPGSDLPVMGEPDAPAVEEDALPRTGPRITALTPSSVSAVGGAVLTITGAGLDAPDEVRVGGVSVEVLEAADDAIQVRSPRLLAGRYDVEIVLEDHPVLALPGALETRALELAFAAAPPELSEAPEAGEVRDAVGLDIDLDDDPDLVLATDDGLRVLLNDGEGRLELLRVFGEDKENLLPARPGGPLDSRALVPGDFDADGVMDLMVCTGGSREVVLRPSAAGLAAAPDLPLRAGRCVGGAAIHANRDGALDAALLIEDGGSVGLHALLGGDGFHFSEPLAPPASGTTPIGQVSGPGQLERTDADAADGAGAGRITWSSGDAGSEATFLLPTDLPLVPERLEMQVRAEAPVQLRVRVVDAVGAAFDGPSLTVSSTAWGPLVAEGIVGWGAEAEPQAPIAAVGLVITAEAQASETLWIDAVEASAGETTWLVEDFEEREPVHAWPDATGLVAGDVDGDALDDLFVLLGSPAAPTFLRTRPAALGQEPDPVWLPGAAPVDGLGPFPDGGVVDADADGDLDLVLVSSAGQDRLLVGDGWGQLIDATLGGLPTDWVEGRAVAVADFDLDGNSDLVLGNRDASDRLYVGLGDGRFADHTPKLGFDTLGTVAVVVADLDGDGDEDVVSISNDGSQAPLLRFLIPEGHP